MSMVSNAVVAFKMKAQALVINMTARAYGHTFGQVHAARAAAVSAAIRAGNPLRSTLGLVSHNSKGMTPVISSHRVAPTVTIRGVTPPPVPQRLSSESISRLLNALPGRAPVSHAGFRNESRGPTTAQRLATSDALAALLSTSRR